MNVGLYDGVAGVGQRHLRLQPPLVESVAEHHRHGRRHEGVAEAHDGVLREVGLLADVSGGIHPDAVAVIDQDAAGGVVGRDRDGIGRPGVGRLGGRDRLLAGAQPERSEVEELVRRRQHVVAGGLHQHPLERLARAAEQGVGQRHGGGESGAGFDDRVVRGGGRRELGLVLELAGRAGDLDAVADRDGGIGRVEEHEDAVAGALGAFGRRIRRLEIQAAVVAGRRVIGGDDPLDGDGSGRESGGVAGALHGGDGDGISRGRGGRDEGGECECCGRGDGEKGCEAIHDESLLRDSVDSGIVGLPPIGGRERPYVAKPGTSKGGRNVHRWFPIP